MNIQTVAQNLRNTISRKEKYLAEQEAKVAFSYHPQRLERGEEMAVYATIEFLKININELKVILFDVEKCVEKDVLQRWKDNPDRMGGQFTQDEIDRSGGWQ